MKQNRESVIALLGQPNSGKSTLFNGLTGMRQHVGNWPGKTVEKKEGYFTYDGLQYTVVDLPGSYSLSANSEEEVITRDIMLPGKQTQCVFWRMPLSLGEAFLCWRIMRAFRFLHFLCSI